MSSKLCRVSHDAHKRGIWHSGTKPGAVPG